VKKLRTSRRRFLKLAAGASVATTALDFAGATLAAAKVGDKGPPMVVGDRLISLEFDPQMRLRVSGGAAALTPGAAAPTSGGAAPQAVLTTWSAPDAVQVGAVELDAHGTSADKGAHVDSGARVSDFELASHSKQDFEGPYGKGTRLQLVGRSQSAPIEKSVTVELYHDYPGLAVYQVSFRNLGREPLAVHGWSQLDLTVPHEPGPRDTSPADTGVHGSSPSDLGRDEQPEFWSFCGSTHHDRRDWVQPVRVGFQQDNFMGMEASDYGGGTPIVDVWRRTGGLAIGHLEPTPKLVSLPLTCGENDLKLSMTAKTQQTLKNREELTLPQAFVATHSGDYFVVLDAYRRLMAVRGIASPKPPKAAYDAVWCAWGYERECTLQLVVDTLPKVRELGLRWAVLDDGWQTNVGDWKVSTARYPGGEDDMRNLVKKIRSQGLDARLWWAPLAVAPGADLLHDHTDMLLLDKEGAVQNVSWWNSFYLCPGYQPTVDYMTGLVRKFIGDWGYAGLKIDGQHLNSVAPCYNPAHKHARPEESVEKLQDFFQAVYQAALQSNPEAVVELCPCGTSYSFFNFRSFNSAPASDPESSWQVRHKGKSLKALMGPSAAFAGDHVELSTGGADFASTVGIGGIVSTKFTWPHDPKPKDSFLLTPAKEPIWRKWISLYNRQALALGTYRGELYDIGFDRPETHVIEKAGRFYYAFYGRNFSGPVPLRGLKGGRYHVRDYYNDRKLGEVSAKNNQLQVAFNDFLVIEAVPA
jgi:alpha-galactosidase